MKGLKGKDQCEKIHVFILVVLSSTIFEMGKGQKSEELWEVRLDSDLDFSERVVTRDKGDAMLGILKSADRIQKRITTEQ